MSLGSGRSEKKNLLLLVMWTSLSQHTPCSYVWDRRWMLSGLLIPIPSSCCREQTGGFRQCNQVSHHLGSPGETESGRIEGKGITSPICRRTEFQGWEYQPAEPSVCSLMTGGWQRATMPAQIMLNVGRHIRSAACPRSEKMSRFLTPANFSGKKCLNHVLIRSCISSSCCNSCP